jgi:DNA-binding transcriptional MerR regulator/effector-binding domain-containing protein
MTAGLTIGEFSRITHLSIKMLRRYHDAGLLEPDRVDAHTGYRYYSLEQLPTAQVIYRFRDLGMPVREVSELLSVVDPDARTALIAQHLRRLEAQLEETRAAVTSLRRLLQPDPAPLQVYRRRSEPTTVAAVRGVVDLDEILSWYDGAVRELDSLLTARGVLPTGPPGGLYDNELFTHERGGVIVYVPVDEPPTQGPVEPFVLPAVDLVTTIHIGPHDDIDVTYGSLGTYVSQQALQIEGPIQEIYHVGPRDTDDSSAWRTEIGWPVFQTSPRNQ